MTLLDTAALILRLLIGLTMAIHGWNHLFGPGGLEGTARWFGSMGLRPPKLHALMSGAGEIVGGLALVAGLLTPLACAYVIGAMTVAGVTAHRKNGFFVFKDGYEYVLVIGVVSAVIALLGPGTSSVDALLGIARPLSGAVGVTIAVLGGVLGASALLAATWRPAAKENLA
jgi:putative oxidoreductase